MAVKKTKITKSKENKEDVETISQPLSNKNKSKYAIILVVLIIIGLGFYFKSLFIAATVNNELIFRVTLIKELEKQAGKQVLNSLVTKTLINQEARKKGVTVGQAEINDEIKKIENNLESQGQKLDQLLELQGMTRKDLEDQIRVKKIVEKIIGKEITVSDKEVDDYIKDNKITITDPEKTEETRKNIKEQLKQKKLNEKVRAWLEDLQSKAQINYLIKFKS